MSSKTLVLMLGVCVFLAAGTGVLFAAPDSATTATREISFDLKYLGLTAKKGEPRYGMCFGFEQMDEANTSFTKSLNLPRGKGLYVRHDPETATLGGYGDSMALEMDENRAVALYIDLNDNGKLSPNERILPSKDKSPIGEGTLFLTPDFKAKTKDGKETLYRFLLIQTSGEPQTRDGRKSKIDILVFPACVWEGSASMDGRPFHLVLFDRDFDGLLSTLGKDRFLLIPEAEYAKALERDVSLQAAPLNRLTIINGQFYDVRVETAAGSAQPSKAVLKKSEIATSKLVLEIRGSQGVKANLATLQLRVGEENLLLVWDGASRVQKELPVGTYEMAGPTLHYGSEKPDEWTVNILMPSGIRVEAGSPYVMKLGELKLTPCMESMQERANRGAKRQTIFRKGDDILCYSEVRGSAGESYTRFKKIGGGNIADPQVRILNAEGRQVASGSTSYG
jgi:hypothetical protein